MTADEPGLGVLLAAGWRGFTDLLHGELTADGHPGLRPAFGPVFKALRDSELTTTELAERLGVTKQAVAKVIRDMRDQGLVESRAGSTDARARPLTLTPHGRDVMAQGSTVAEEVEQRLQARIGPEALASLKESLGALADLAGSSEDVAHGRTKAPW